VAGPGPAAASRKPEFDRRNVKITRILTVCDVYDALVSARVYRPAWSEDDALALVRSEAGTAFDARCVDVLIRVLGQNVAELRSAPAMPRLSRAG
jgi:HD-GYP domain-containing protein (c-di-GMP phosphodiesterase class II)